MRIALALFVAIFTLAGCQTAQQAGSSGTCNQAGSSVDASVICPN